VKGRLVGTPVGRWGTPQDFAGPLWDGASCFATAFVWFQLMQPIGRHGKGTYIVGGRIDTVRMCMVPLAGLDPRGVRHTDTKHIYYIEYLSCTLWDRTD